jgi:hypothetical protein
VFRLGRALNRCKNRSCSDVSGIAALERELRDGCREKEECSHCITTVARSGESETERIIDRTSFKIRSQLAGVGRREKASETRARRERRVEAQGGVAEELRRKPPLAGPVILPTLQSPPHITHRASCSSQLFLDPPWQPFNMSSALPPPPPPQWVVTMNSPLPRPTKAASSIPDPPGFSSSRGGKQVSLSSLLISSQ